MKCWKHVSRILAVEVGSEGVGYGQFYIQFLFKSIGVHSESQAVFISRPCVCM